MSESVFDLEGSGTNYKFSIVELSAGSPDMTISLYSVTNPWCIGLQTISGIDLALTPGSQYAAVIDFLGYTGVSVSYLPFSLTDGNAFFGDVSGGNSWMSFLDLTLAFDVEFVPANAVPEPTALTFVGIGLAGLTLIRKRKPNGNERATVEQMGGL